MFVKCVGVGRGCWAWAWMLGVGVGVGRSVTNDWRKRGGVFYLFLTNPMFLNGVGVGCFVTNDRRQRGGVFYLFLTNPMFLNGVGVGCFVTNDRRKRGGVFYLFWTNSMFLNGVFNLFSQISIFKRARAWSVSVKQFHGFQSLNYDLVNKLSKNRFCTKNHLWHWINYLFEFLKNLLSFNLDSL